MISELTELARDASKPPEKRLLAGSNLYLRWVIVAVIRAADGQLVIYNRTVIEISSWQKTLEVRAEVNQDLTIIRWQMAQDPWLLGIFVCASIVALIAGLGFYAFGRPASRPGDIPATTPDEADQHLPALGRAG